jgi:antitoxin (DNA-binding transcriptional repressor) of toxin-antitoxin stability system
MQTVTLEEAQSRLSKLIEALPPGEEVIVTRDDKPVARIIAEPAIPGRPVPGRCKGMLTVIREDDEHLNDFAEYMP